MARRPTAPRADPHFFFFGGKGGVGKTTCAAAAALVEARRGANVLVVSTDPAHSLGDALGHALGRSAREIAPRLFAAELDADRALAAWLFRRSGAIRTIASRGTYLDDEDIDKLLRLSLPGVDELIGLLELRRLAHERAYDAVVVDTAPTGHTLRLLEMPDTLGRIAQVLDDMQAKHRFLAESLGGAARRDAADAVVHELADDASELHALLRDPTRADFAWVLLPEAMSIEETKDGVAALDARGVRVRELIVNRTTPAPSTRCAQCTPRVKEEERAVRELARALPGRSIRTIAALDAEPRGLDALVAIAKKPARPTERIFPHPKPSPGERRASGGSLRSDHVRLMLFGGKGGVGKTTCAAAYALAFAAKHPKKRVLLLSTDPAHSLADVLEVPLGDDARRTCGVFARELDANAALRDERDRYRDAVDDLFDALLGGSRFDATFDRVVVRDLIDLAPPGLDELFATLALVDALTPRDPAARAYDLVVVDTAPTGHTLRLLAMPKDALEWVHALLEILLKYRKVLGLGELASDLLTLAKKLRELDALLHDPARARFVAVTRPAELPRLETARLVRALEKMRVPVGAVIVNAVTHGSCARCARAAAAESREIERIAALRQAMLLAPAAYPPPRGEAALRRWGARWMSIE